MMLAVIAWLERLSAEPVLLLLASLATVAWLATLLVMWRRIDGLAWRLAQCLTSTAALVALLGVLQPPLVRASVGTAVLVTPGAGEAALATLPPRDDVFVIDAAWREPAVAAAVDTRRARTDSGRTVRVAAVDEVLRYRRDIARLRVIGDGLSAADWFASRFDGDIEFSPAPAGVGITGARFADRLAPGEALTVEADVHDAANDRPLRLDILDEDGTRRASASLSSSAPLLLSVSGLSPGRQRLTMTLVDAAEDRVIEAVPLPVVVERPPRARLLLLQAAPSFEWRALSRWAARSGADIVSRVRISESRYRVRTSGTLDLDPARIDARSLSEVDLVVADGASLAQLSAAEIETLLSASHGAGVLLLLHDAGDLAALPPAIGERLAIADGDPVIYRLEDMGPLPDTGLSRLPVGFDARAVLPMLTDDRGRSVTVRLRDRPHVALSLLRDSYRLVGIGRDDLHARLWSGLVTALARPAESDQAIFEPGRARTDTRLMICLPDPDASQALRVRESDGRESVLPLWRTRWRPAAGCGWLWPRSAGWLRVSDDDGRSRGAVYVLAPDAWRSREQAMRNAATLQRAGSALAASEAVAMRRVAMARDWPFIAWLSLALLSWLIQRLAMTVPGPRRAR